MRRFATAFAICLIATHAFADGHETTAADEDAAAEAAPMGSANVNWLVPLAALAVIAVIVATDDDDPPVVVSDMRLKTDIEPIGRTVHGLTEYRFRYVGSDATYAGVMAQDVLHVMPEAVTTGPLGYYRVDYQMLGVEMRQLAH